MTACVYSVHILWRYIIRENAMRGRFLFKTSENDACMNGNIDWIEVKESFENEFPGYSKTQLKNQYHSMKKRSVFEVTSNSRQVSSAPSLSSSQEISASFNTSSSSTEVTTLTTASVSRSSLPFPTSKVASQNNSTYSLAEIRNTSLDVPTKRQQFRSYNIH